MRIVVDLPAPLGPTNPVTLPGLTVKVSSSTAGVDPKRFFRPRTSIVMFVMPVNVRRTHIASHHVTVPSSTHRASPARVTQKPVAG